MCDSCDNVITPPACPACGGESIPLGVLGTLLHCRCRQCGMGYSTDLEPTQPAEDAEE
jgi:hypothetical protein